MRRRAICAVAVVVLLAAGCGRSSSEKAGEAVDQGGTATTAPAANSKCEGVALEATDVGVTPDTITITVMADTGSPLAPGLFQGNIDAVQAFAKHVNDNGGVGCRKLVAQAWDSRLDPTEAKNGLITACQTSLAMVGNNALFNPDMTPLTGCPDKAGAPTGVPDLAALAADVNELCAPVTFTVQAQVDKCPIQSGVRPITMGLGYWKWLLSQYPDAKGIYLVPGDLPTTVLGSMPILESAKRGGIDITDAVKVSGRDEQSAYTPRVQLLRNTGGNFVYNGSNDVAMVNMRKEADAQGLDTVKVWACSVSCYTEAFKSQGSAVDGTYVSMQFLPFEEKDKNQELANYLDNVSSPSSWGANAWQSSVLFQQAVDKIVETDGPNAITRANLLKALQGIDTFDANGWMAPKPMKGMAACMVVMQIEGGQFHRVFPEEPGTFACNPDDLVQIDIDPAAAAAGLQ